MTVAIASGTAVNLLLPIPATLVSGGSPSSSTIPDHMFLCEGAAVDLSVAFCTAARIFLKPGVWPGFRLSVHASLVRDASKSRTRKKRA